LLVDGLPESLSDWLESDPDWDDSEIDELALDGWLRLTELSEPDSLESERDESLDSDSEDDPDETEAEELAELEWLPELGKLVDLLESLSDSLDPDSLLLPDETLESLDDPLAEEEPELGLDPSDESESDLDESDDCEDSELSLDEWLEDVVD